jgi:hypothetical protein
MKINFLFQLPLQNIFPERFDRMMLYPTDLIDLLQLKSIVIEYLELPIYLPEVIDGEYICQLNSVGVQEEPALVIIWPKNSAGILQEDVYIIADLELVYRDGDYKQFLVKPKRFVDVINIIEFDVLASSHSLGLFKSTSTAAKYYKQL